MSSRVPSRSSSSASSSPRFVPGNTSRGSYRGWDRIRRSCDQSESALEFVFEKEEKSNSLTLPLRSTFLPFEPRRTFARPIFSNWYQSCRSKNTTRQSHRLGKVLKNGWRSDCVRFGLWVAFQLKNTRDTNVNAGGAWMSAVAGRD